MLEIDRKTVEYIAELSKIELSDVEKDKMILQLQDLVAYFELLGGLDTESTEPMSHVFDIRNVLREDVVKPSFDREDILANAENRNGECFIVPKTVE